MFVKRIAFCLLWFWVFYSMNAVAQQSILQDDDEYAIHAGVSSDASAAGQKKIITLQIFDKITGMSKEISISNRTETIVNLYHYEQEQLLIHGKLGSGGDVITFVHLPTSQVIDTIWGWDASISPDFTKIAYNFRYPPQSIPLYRTSVLLVYDLTKTPKKILWITLMAIQRIEVSSSGRKQTDCDNSISFLRRIMRNNSILSPQLCGMRQAQKSVS